jgi:hypothetical protein
MGKCWAFVGPCCNRVEVLTCATCFWLLSRLDAYAVSFREASLATPCQNSVALLLRRTWAFPGKW